jgi:(2Fe-2S) ferredoxin
MNYSHPQRMEFNFEGQFLGFAGERDKFKYLRLGMVSEKVEIKIPKELRAWVSLYCLPGTTIQVTGIGKFDPCTQELKLKASQITPVSELVKSDGRVPITLPSPIPHSHKPKIKIFVCQKSGCLKKGGKGLCESLEATLRDRNLHHHVSIQKTGCLKRCSDAPNLMVMPGKHQFKKIRPELLAPVYQTIVRILEKQLQTL